MIINYNTQKEKYNGFEKFWLNAWNECYNKNNWLSVYQNKARIYLDEYQEDRNLFFENRWLRKQ